MSVRTGATFRWESRISTVRSSFLITGTLLTETLVRQRVESARAYLESLRTSDGAPLYRDLRFSFTSSGNLISVYNVGELVITGTSNVDRGAESDIRNQITDALRRNQIEPTDLRMPDFQLFQSGAPVAPPTPRPTPTGGAAGEAERFIRDPANRTIIQTVAGTLGISAGATLAIAGVGGLILLVSVLRR
jgi:hypothetical protein